ncbi:hypothetical protein FNV43_RR12592 [Rhamnella rubrinervis]|uniref:AP2/ERF domain-containing protein n=1 Tax=Rhamnella rubrinervis TaxID=2594499 RepID=A0A8K0H7K9_9ROSA|nr:hypothetical protein FNV43_RR12592 [Rhamnella rubrinervis]
MSCSSEEVDAQRKYKGVRQRKWGKWVSEIRVPGTYERLWLGSYSTPEAAAVARDVAFYCLRRPLTTENLNLPLMLPASVHADMSPRSVQKAASDAGMAVDAGFVVQKSQEEPPERKVHEGGATSHWQETQVWEDMESNSSGWLGESAVRDGEGLSISIEDYL